jgi:hypothetical protein
LDAQVAVTRLAAAIERLDEAEFASLTDAQLVNAMIALRRLFSSLEATTTRAVGVSNARHAFDGDGA